MRNLFLCLFSLGIIGMVNAQSDYELIEQTLGYYMEGGSNRDFNTLKKAFHETATMKYITEEGYKEVNALEFFSGMKTGDRINRKNRIAEITVSGHAANARLELEYPDFTFVDFMNLLKIDGEWKIVNKIFYKRLD
ncbi:nuclear transport factor 2 family protein [Flagellimonas algicola]|uniref:Nuclear transport factor 2 family protein n=1 Tax=Flagellimonas algicola TaxID=2583815 RepID=A0ABY2WLS9_9FLAO|nr:nuclear transport factor 2 family protein [Allomuricauda algicola]TMU55683.1 nuclear transport factor 2 family protein [Allomuricauda algicola]